MKKLDEILGELERVLMNTYKSDGCVTSAITEIHKDQAIFQILKWIREQLPEKRNPIDVRKEGWSFQEQVGRNQAIDDMEAIFK